VVVLILRAAGATTVNASTAFAAFATSAAAITTGATESTAFAPAARISSVGSCGLGRRRWQISCEHVRHGPHHHHPGRRNHRHSVL